MIKNICGSLLESKEDIILHQVNVQGFMGGGVALQIANAFPQVEEGYINFIKENGINGLLGKVYFHKTENFVVGNCFSQDEDFTTNYESLKICIEEVKKYMKDNNLKTVAIPHKYGCGIASGDWGIVSKIFEENFDNLYIYNIHKED